MGVPVLDSRGKPTGEVLERAMFHRSASTPVKERRVHPAIHVTVYDLQVRVLEQLRAKTKKFLPNIWFPINGGHGDEIDLHKVNSHYVFGWREGGVRELHEELGIVVDPKDLHNLDEKLLDLTQACKFENRMYLRAYYLMYDPKKHGEFKINSSEVQDLRFRKPTYAREFHLLSPLGKEYASRMAKRIVARSRKL